MTFGTNEHALAINYIMSVHYRSYNVACTSMFYEILRHVLCTFS